jgi:uroporphyrinogen III methyltransferase/synthase
VLYDYLVNPQMLAHAGTAELICLGRHGRSSLWTPEAIQYRLVSEARQGKTVVRLKCGDPMVFARAAGEIESLVEAGVPFEVVPGITAALAAASYAGVPITDRRLASAVAFVTGQETGDKLDDGLDYGLLAQFPGTLVVYMGVTTAATWTERLMQAGMPPELPVALIHRCSWPSQRVIRCRLEEVAGCVTPYSEFPPPVIAIVGNVAREAAGWNWFERRLLFGQTVLVTRARHQSDDLHRQLTNLGAEVLLQPVVEIRDPPSWQDVDQAISQLPTFDGLVFSSANGVERFLGRLLGLAMDLRKLSGVQLAALGPGTAKALARFHLHADVQPATGFRAESLVDQLATGAAGKKYLLVRASRGRDVLADGLRAAGAQVDEVIAYQSVDVQAVDVDVAERLAQAAHCWVIVTSSSIARAAAQLLGDVCGKRARWVSISSLTSQALREVGIEPTLEAKTATMDGLIQAIVRQIAAG